MDIRLMWNQDEILTLGKIAFLNVLPIYFPLESGIVEHPFRIVPGTPAELNERMRRGELHMSAVSSVMYARYPELFQLLPGLAIACDGPVQSVLLLSRRPVEYLDGEEIVLTRQSDTSVVLLRILMEKLLGFKSVRYRRGNLDEDHTRGRRPAAFLAIGDEALRFRRHPDYPYVWDLAEVWKQWTGHPFVFAVWVVQRKIGAFWKGRLAQAVEKLWEAKRWGMAHLDHICRVAEMSGILGTADLERYYKTFIFDLDEETLNGLTLFFQYMVQVGEIKEAPLLEFFPMDGKRGGSAESSRDGGEGRWAGDVSG